MCLIKTPYKIIQKKSMCCYVAMRFKMKSNKIIYNF